VPGRLSGSPTRGGERTNAIARSCGGAALTAGRKEEARRHDRCVAPDARAQSWRFLTGLPQLTPPSVDPSATNTRRAPLGSVLLLKRSGILGPSRFGICLESRVAHLAGSRSHGCLFAGGRRLGWLFAETSASVQRFSRIQRPGRMFDRGGRPGADTSLRSDQFERGTERSR
jgi:hypothetical protein